MKYLQDLYADTRGMSLSTKIALGFGSAVAVIIVVGVIVYLVRSATA